VFVQCARDGKLAVAIRMIKELKNRLSSIDELYRLRVKFRDHGLYPSRKLLKELVMCG